MTGDSKPPQLKKGPWVVLKFVAPNGKPIPHVRAKVTTPDGKVHDVESDLAGHVILASEVQGECQIEYC